MTESIYFVALLFLAAMFGFGINAWQMRIDCVDDDGNERECTGTEIGYIVQRGCDMVTIVVPPALPLALTVGVIYAVSALRQEKLYCISPTKINLAGKVNAVCFDKTGTLTTDSLELAVVHPSSSSSADGTFQQPVRAGNPIPRALSRLLSACHSLTHVNGKLAGDPLEIQTFAATGATLDEPHTPGGADLAAKLASTPSLTARVRGADGHVMHVVGVFEFQPALQRMGVLVEEPDGSVTSFVKGSPEVIASLSNSSTIPRDFQAVLTTYTKRGFRVLAAASKVYTGPLPLPGSDIAPIRAEAEKGLNFLGFVVLDNALKPQSAPTVRRLRGEANVWMAMVTGDNAITAVCVARQCQIVEEGYRVFVGDVAAKSAASGDGDASSSSSSSSSSYPSIVFRDADDETSLLDPETLEPLDGSKAKPYKLALTGAAFAALYARHNEARARVLAASGGAGAAAGAGAALSSRGLPADPSLDYFPRVVLNCAVFARMSPDAKAHVVEVLQSTGLYVLMIGDGANDALALRAAHVGISLSQVEASVAAPFTYAVPNPSIEAVPLLLCEGRGALTTSFCLFQFMALYSTIQFANALLIVFADSFLSNNMYLYQDLYIVFVLALTLGNTPAARVLTFKRPSGRLFSGANLLITAGFIGFTFGLQAHVFRLVRLKDWYDTEDFPAAMQSDDPYRFNYDYEGTNSAIPETTTVFLMSCVQYVAVATIFSLGQPYKEGTHKNPIFLVWLLFCAVCAILLFFSVEGWIYWLIGMQELPSAWNRELFGWSVLSFFLYFAWWGLIVLARLRGGLRAISNAFCGRKEAQHKRLRFAWRAQFGLPSLPARVVVAQAPPAGAAATAPPPPLKSVETVSSVESVELSSSTASA
jgi:cation-transporting ATPase 13A2